MSPPKERGLHHSATPRAPFKRRVTHRVDKHHPSQKTRGPGCGALPRRVFPPTGPVDAPTEKGENRCTPGGPDPRGVYPPTTGNRRLYTQIYLGEKPPLTQKCGRPLYTPYTTGSFRRDF